MRQEDPVWSMIRERLSFLVESRAGTVHVLRTAARGYGERRRLWRETTECGLIFKGLPPRIASSVCRLSRTTCLSCVTVMCERDAMSAAEDALVEYERQQIDEMWRIQAEWHRPEPAALWEIPATLNYSLMGG